MIHRTTILSVLIAGALSVALFSLKYQVRDLEGELKDLNRAMAREQQAIHVLKAEWSHLNDLQRLRELAERYLGLEPIGGSQLSTLSGLPLRPESTTLSSEPARVQAFKQTNAATTTRIER
jgi:cell division protein FtsL